ncbi:uncharacterized protein METZ01_LOCUS436293 [marine metagenome]|uniref:Uncharacterized protein n=1 Tax=marine metagenome TaxID=408172 RepID=A0A382YKE1_9ZZZZ
MMSIDLRQRVSYKMKMKNPEHHGDMDDLVSLVTISLTVILALVIGIICFT